MRRAASLATALLLAACSGGQPAAENTAQANASAAPDSAQGVPTWLRANDGVAIKGTIWQAANPKAVILLFHQADSSKEEYATIGPRLAAAGYTALAIDQRSGGTMFGKNETVAKLGHSADYLDTLPDYQAAIGWARPLGKPVILWGSSYSASLAFPTATANAGAVTGLLAFSPGEYFTDKHLVTRAAQDLRIPAFITSAADPAEESKARAIAGAIPGKRATLYVPVHGIHGSATLIPAKDPDGAEANWAPVMTFLKRVAP